MAKDNGNNNKQIASTFINQKIENISDETNNSETTPNVTSSIDSSTSSREGTFHLINFFLYNFIFTI